MESFLGYKTGNPIHLGNIEFTKQQIIDFATQFDPLDFHTNEEAAKATPFKALIASGPQLFTTIHKNKWIPLFGKTVIAGMEVTNWKFAKPLYANQLVACYVTPKSLKGSIEKGYAVIDWFYEFKDAESQDYIQYLNMVVMHKFS
ncbi:MAG: hypothetical protein J0M08_12260 [Bacteroidetes bacterium]|nr:hypothetical protein [Bacteroidota bacterium]